MARTHLEILADRTVENLGALVRDYVRVPAVMKPSPELAAEHLRRDMRAALVAAFDAVETQARDTLRGLPAYQTVANDDGEGPLIDLHDALKALNEPEPSAAPEVQS